MKNSFACFVFLAIALALGGCQEAIYRSAEAKRIQEYDRQTTKTSEQQVIADRQLESTDEQSKRMDALLQRWEKQADRYDAILRRWEKQSPLSGR
jgi:hypothetical protein